MSDKHWEHPEFVIVGITRSNGSWVDWRALTTDPDGCLYVRADIYRQMSEQVRDAWFKIGSPKCSRAPVPFMAEKIVELRNALVEILEWVMPCNCDEAYSSRGLIAPDCQYHASGMEEVEEIAKRALGLGLEE